MADLIHIFSPGLWRLREEVAALTGLTPRRAFLSAAGGAIAGWGHKPTAQRARNLARRTGLPYIAFEDGFLRSLKPGPAQRPVAMIADRSGIYYDARQPSDLETLLETSTFSAAETAEATNLVNEIRTRRLSKYNHGADHLADAGRLGGRPLVLLIDQTRGDESVAGGLADGAIFTRMAEAAVAENPGATLAVKLHPEVISGAKQGYLLDAARRFDMVLIAGQVTPWALIELAPRVYTVSSQFGFEAMLAGLKVTCFGLPFYAGWGLTDDRQSLARRTARRSAAEIAAAAYLRYSRYFDVWRRTPVDAMTALDQLHFQRRHYLSNGQPIVCCGIARWKRRAVAAMLDGPAGPPAFTGSLRAAATLATRRGAAIALWGARAGPRRQRLAADGIACLAVEDGFIRSAGLGAAFVAPLSLVFDGRGIYYDPTAPSDIEWLLNNAQPDGPMLARGKLLRQRIISAGVTKYNLAAGPPAPAIPPGLKAVLVAGQVADDAAVLASGETGNVNARLLAAVRRRFPEAYVIFKPHPDVERLGRSGAISSGQERRDADLVVRGTSLETLLPVIDRLATHSSLSGFEALLRGVAVTVHGLPFYAGWGLTEDLASSERRGRKLPLDALTAIALEDYPRYWDPVSGLACDAAMALDRLAEMRTMPPGLNARLGLVAGRAVIAWRNVARGLGLRLRGAHGVTHERY